MTAWELPFPVPASVLELAAGIDAAVFDVDGVLTDGSLLFDHHGNEHKRFDAHDGHGLKLLLQAGIKVGVISARESTVVATRVTELGIEYFYPGRSDKKAALGQFVAQTGIGHSNICYTGDDIVDLPPMLRCGLAIAVNNANHVVKKVAHWITPNDGGRGAVRQICEMILFARNQLDHVIDGYMGRD